jgi:hypothetical protein
MSGLTMQVLLLKGGRGGDALRFVVAIARFAMLVSLSLATFAFLTVTASQACVGHDGGAHFISQKSSSPALRSIAANGARMTMIGNADFGCGAPGSTDQTGCACCSTHSPAINTAGVAQFPPSGRPIEIAPRKSLLASIDSIPELRPPIVFV